MVHVLSVFLYLSFINFSLLNLDSHLRKYIIYHLTRDPDALLWLVRSCHNLWANCEQATTWDRSFVLSKLLSAFMIMGCRMFSLAQRIELPTVMRSSRQFDNWNFTKTNEPWRHRSDGVPIVTSYGLKLRTCSNANVPNIRPAPFMFSLDHDRLMHVSHALGIWIWDYKYSISSSNIWR